MRSAVFFSKDKYLKQSPCPRCRTDLTGITPVSLDGSRDFIPGEGDFSVCVYCGAILRYEIGLRLRECTLDDLRELHNSQPEQLELLQKMAACALQAVDHRRKGNRGKN